MYLCSLDMVLGFINERPTAFNLESTFPLHKARPVLSKQKERKLLWLVGLVISCCHQKNVYVVGLHPRGSSPPFPFFSWNNCRRLWQWTNGHPWFQRFMLVAKLAPSFFKDPPLSPGTLPDLQCRVIARASLSKVILYVSRWELFLLHTLRCHINE